VCARMVGSAGYALMLAWPGEQGKRLEQEKPAVKGPVALEVRGSQSTVRWRNAARNRIGERRSRLNSQITCRACG
jgi:hypothetical protein